MDMPPFYVGQRVVCICNHSINLVVKNRQYTITHVGKCSCKCGDWSVEVNYMGASRKGHYLQCGGCNTITENKGIYEMDPTLFAPIQENFSKVTYTQILEEVEMCNN